MNAAETYIKERDEQVRKNMDDLLLARRLAVLTEKLVTVNYAKTFTWAGIPILQYPGDLMVMQEILWTVKPTVIIETGVAFGGMTRFYADMLDLIYGLEICPRVLAVDIDIRQHTRDALGSNIRIDLIAGSSMSPDVVERVTRAIEPEDTVLVSLDSNHTHAHVLQELELYAPLVSVGSYIVAFDTAIEFFHHLDKNQNRPWSSGNSPFTAVQAFLKTDLGKCFEVDREVETRALLTAAPGGYLRRTQ